MTADSPHIPVLLEDVLDALTLAPGDTIVDGTFGAGGYTRALLAAGADVIAIDRDPTAIAAGRALEAEANGRLTLVEGRFSDLDDIVAETGRAHVDGVVLDLGVSSMQLDRAERGFSFRLEGPLDMRMGADGPSAADLVASLSEEALADVIYTYGEEHASRRIARAIVARRAETPFTTTRDLADVVGKVVGFSPKDRSHPATRTFQALRIAVNTEFEEIAAVLGAAERVLRPGGRLVVVTFHSLEDRIVKTFMVERSTQARGSRHQPTTAGPAPTFRLTTRKAVAPSEAEIERNPRARSAKLRSAIRTDVAPRALDPRALGVVALDDLVRSRPKGKGGRR